MNFYANILEGKESKRLVIGDDYFLQTKEEIENWLKKMKIKNYVINGDLTVNVNGRVDLSFKSLEKIPIKFNIIKGNFSCSDNELTSLKGCPEKVGGSFYCYNNKLTSLEGCPEKVGGSFYCYNNELTSLKGCPKIIYGDFHCADNELTSLEYCPKEVGGGFYCYSNKLTSLEGCPKKIEGEFECNNNKLTSLKYFPIIKKGIYIYDNPIETLKGLENISVVLLIKLIQNYPKLDWGKIEWDKVKNIDEIITELYENIERGENIEHCEEALKRIEELQLF